MTRSDATAIRTPPLLPNETPTPVAGGSRALLALYEVSKILSASLDLDATLRQVLGVLAAYRDMRRGAIALTGEGTSELALVATIGRAPEAAASGPGAYPMAVAAEVLKSGHRLVVGRMAEDTRFADYLAHAGVLESERVSFLCVPIKAGAETLGTLSVERSWAEGTHHLDDDLQFLSMVANLVGQSVRLHRLVVADRRALMGEAARQQKRARAQGGAEVRAPRMSEIVGRGPAMRAVLDKVQQVARTRAAVMLRGESGTGKEMIARALHRFSPRADKPFIGLNCAALPDTLLEAELFGHDKGAFTGAGGERKGRFEMADGGTLFLDEIGEISPTFQAKLLRVLQEGQFERLGSSKTRTVDVRIIAATNRNLEQAVAEGTFRADLYYRINVVTLVLPPLRERREDIEPLARHFLERFNQENGESLGFDDDALALLTACAFPGNVRELENCITRVATMVRGDVIRSEDFACREEGCLSAVLGRDLGGPTMAIGGLAPPTGAHGGALGGSPPGCGSCGSAGGPPSMPAAPPTSNAPPVGAPPISDDMGPDSGGDDAGGKARLPDRARLIDAMERAGWVQAKAARLLGLTPRQVGYALRRHDIPIKRI
jgi:Nif-specific regulatory protein